MTNQRKAGWYWVRINDNWGCMCFNGTRWQVLDERMEDEFFDEIGPRIPKPDEPWQCVPISATKEMAENGEDAFGIPQDCDAIDCEFIYAAMISSSPKPEDT